MALTAGAVNGLLGLAIVLLEGVTAAWRLGIRKLAVVTASLFCKVPDASAISS